jgi:hypothetical protein
MTDLNIIGVIEDFNQAVLDNEQKIIFNLNSVDPNIKQYKTLFKSREELIDSIKILYKKCESDNPLYEKRIEQNIKFIKFVNSSNSIYCKTIHFNNGRQKNISNNIITSASEQISNNLNDNPLPYDVNLLEIHPCENASVNDCISAIIELKLNIIMKDWTLSIILVKYWCASIEYSKILNIPEKYVSIHLRATDIKLQVNKTVGHNDSLIMIDEFIKKHYTENVFVAGDNPKLIEKLKKKYPTIIKTESTKVSSCKSEDSCKALHKSGKTDPNNLKQALIDLLILAGGTAILTTQGGFSRLAKDLQKRPDILKRLTT